MNMLDASILIGLLLLLIFTFASYQDIDL